MSRIEGDVKGRGMPSYCKLHLGAEFEDMKKAYVSLLRRNDCHNWLILRLRTSCVVGRDVILEELSQ